MSIPGILISFIVALLGLAYPLLLQVVTRIEDRYKSSMILNKLLAEKSWKFYRRFLVISLILVLLYIIRNYPALPLKGNYMAIITHIIVVLMIISTSLLIISFSLFINKLLDYDSISRITQYLISKDRESPEEEEHHNFIALKDILLGTVRDRNITIAHTISDYLYEAFQRYRDKTKDSPVEYPYQYYELVYQITEELALAKERGIPFLMVRTVGGIWLFGEARGYKIHETTYRCIWRNLILSVKYQRDDFLLTYWERADIYYSNNLSPFYQPDDSEEAVNRRKKFLEFHYALGGLVLYSGLHNVLLRFFQFTRSQPPKYELLPVHMNEIFTLFFLFRDPYERNFLSITMQYYFPDIEGINSEYVVKNWICKYLALLFLRQYSIVPYLITMRPLEKPTLPDNQQGRKMWIDNLGHFKSLVLSILEDQELIKAVKLDFINDDWCREFDKPIPKEFFDELISDVKAEYEKAEVEQGIDPEKRNLFFRSTEEILTATFLEYTKIRNEQNIEEDYKELFITGENGILDKTAFVADQVAENINFDSILADTISNKYKSGISEIFFRHATIRYVIKSTQIRDAIANLKIQSSDHVIIAFGINNHNLKNLLPELNTETNTYKGIKLVSYQQCNFRLVRESLFILQKDDLPNIENLDVKPEDIERYRLNTINAEHRLMAEVNDLHTDDDLRNMLQQNRPNEDLQRSVLAVIAFVTRIRWKKEMKMVSLRVYSEFEDKGLPIDPKEIDKF